jgi:preprotein translocase subunit SecD
MFAIAMRCKKAGLLGLFLWLAVAAVASPGMAQSPSMAQAPSLLEQLQKGEPSPPPRKSLLPPLRIQVQKAEASFATGSKDPVVVITMAPRSGRMFHELTLNNIGRRLVLRIDGQVAAEPIIKEAIKDGVVQISGGFTLKEAAALAERLSKGETKIEVELVAD